MEVIKIQGTDDTPTVTLDAEKGLFEISGTRGRYGILYTNLELVGRLCREPQPTDRFYL